MILPRPGKQEFPFGLPGQPSREVETPHTAEAKALYARWRELAPVGTAPVIDDIDVQALTAEFPNAYVLDIVGQAQDFFVRAFGAALVDMLGHDFAGILLSQTPRDLKWRGEIYALAYRRNMPVFYLFDLAPFGRSGVTTENGLMPVSGSDGNLAHLLCISVPIEEG